MELLQLKFDSPLHDATGSQISPLHDAVGSQISPLHHAAGSQISPLHHAAGSQISPLHFAAGSQIFLLHFAAERCDSLLHLASELTAEKCSGESNLAAVWFTVGFTDGKHLNTAVSWSYHNQECFQALQSPRYSSCAEDPWCPDLWITDYSTTKYMAIPYI